MRSLSQLLATHGNGFRVVRTFSRRGDLRPVATGCNHGGSIKAPSNVASRDNNGASQGAFTRDLPSRECA